MCKLEFNLFNLRQGKIQITAGCQNFLKRHQYYNILWLNTKDASQFLPWRRAAAACAVMDRGDWTGDEVFLFSSAGPGATQRHFCSGSLWRRCQHPVIVSVSCLHQPTFVVVPDQHRPSPSAGGMLQLGGTLQTIITRTFTCLGLHLPSTGQRARTYIFPPQKSQIWRS